MKFLVEMIVAGIAAALIGLTVAEVFDYRPLGLIVGVVAGLTGLAIVEDRSEPLV